MLVFAKVESEAKASKGIETFQPCISKAAGTIGHYKELLFPHDSKFSRFCLTKAVSLKPINPVYCAKA